MGLVVPGSCAYQVLPWTTAVLEAATRGTPLVETRALEQAEEYFSLAQVEPGTSVAKAAKI